MKKVLLLSPQRLACRLWNAKLTVDMWEQGSWQKLLTLRMQIPRILSIPFKYLNFYSNIMADKPVWEID